MQSQKSLFKDTPISISKDALARKNKGHTQIRSLIVERKSQTTFQLFS